MNKEKSADNLRLIFMIYKGNIILNISDNYNYSKSRVIFHKFMALNRSLIFLNSSFNFLDKILLIGSMYLCY